MEEDIKEKSCENCEEYKKGWQRALADYQNLQKEYALRGKIMYEEATMNALSSFIPVYENMKSAFAHMPVQKEGEEKTNWESWAKGCEMILKHFKDTFASIGVEEINPVPGAVLDTKMHESVGEEVSELEEGKIIKVVNTGYKIGERVLAPARVILSKNNLENK